MSSLSTVHGKSCGMKKKLSTSPLSLSLASDIPVSVEVEKIISSAGRICFNSAIKAIDESASPTERA